MRSLDLPQGPLAQCALLAGGGQPVMIHGKRKPPRPGLPGLALAMLLVCLSGCAAVISRATEPLAENLTQAILNHNDPETVAAAVPTYLVLLDSLPERPGGPGFTFGFGHAS